MPVKPTYEELEQRVYELEKAASEHTTRERTANALELLSFFIHHSPICAFLKKVSHQESKVLYASDNYGAMTGIPASRMIGKNMYELYPLERAEKTTHDDIALVTSGNTVTFEEELHGKTYVTYKFPIQQGEDNYLAGYSVDITSQKQTEEELRKSLAQAEFLSDIIGKTDQPIGIGYPDGSLGFCNSAFCTLTGYCFEELQGMDWAKELTPEKWLPTEMQALQKLAQTGKPVKYEKEYIRKDGSRVPIDMLVHVVVDQSGAPDYYYAFVTDITERKKRERESLILKTAVDQAPVGIALADENISIYYCNPEGLGMRGGLQKELIEIHKDAFSNWQVLMLNGEPYEVDDLPLVRAITRGEAIREEFMVRHQDGTDHICDAAAYPVYENGTIIGGMVIFLDISERKQAENALRRSEKQYKGLFNSIGDAILVADTDRSIIECNPQFTTLFGYSPAELRGKTTEQLYAEKVQFQEVGQVIKKFDPTKHNIKTIYYKKKNGDVFPGETRIFPSLDSEGNLVGFIGMIHDISKRVAAEKTLQEHQEKLKVAMESMTDGVFISDNQGRLIDFNNAWVKFTRFKSKAEALTHLTEYPDLFEVFLPNGKPAPMETWALSRALRGEKSANEEYTIRRKDTGETWVGAYSFSPIYNSEQEIAGSVVVARDITHLKEKEAEKRRLEKRLNQAQKMEAIGNLAGGIAHDFNNILSSIIGFTELAMEAAPDDSPQRDDLEEVYVAGIRAKELVQQILAFARHSEESTKPVRLCDIVTEALKLLRPSTPSTIDIQATINSTAEVQGNPSQLHQVVMNLCTNAIQSLHTTGGVLEIELRAITLHQQTELTSKMLPAGDYVQLTVSDTGEGINPAIIDNIFEPYFTTKEVGDGTGMGLAMVKGITESYGGDISVTSVPGEKTSFVIRLPISKEKYKQPLKQPDQPSLGTAHILLVDDEPPIARMASRLLEDLGYTTTTQTSSVAALELFKRSPEVFDAVLTDMTMPAMTGDVLAQEIRKIRDDIPIILCTGYTDKINDEGAKKLGIDSFAYKPFSKNDLATTIKEALHKR